MQINNKVAVVTGASSGIGQSIAKTLIEENAKAVLCWHSNEAKVLALQEEIDPTRNRTVLFGGNLAEETTVKRLFQEVTEKFDSLDILVNCAGGPVEEGELSQTDYKHWLRTFEANLFSTVLCCKEAVKKMDKGKIVNISSVLAHEFGGREGVIAYSASKAAVDNFTQTLAKQLVPDILVNAVSPGRTLTDYYDRFTDEKKNELGNANKIGRWIDPSEIADAAMFLLRNDAMVGEVMSVDAGFFF